MGAGLLTVKSGFILFIKNYQFPLQINTFERDLIVRVKREQDSCLLNRENESYTQNL